jgi:hypothetical protein
MSSKSLSSVRPAPWRGILARLAGWGRAFVDWRPVVVRLPRSECHFLTLEARGVPTRMLAGSVRLQLLQLTGMGKPGFAFRAEPGKVLVWYWDEDGLAPEKLPGLAASDRKTGFAPWPESLLRAMPGEGLHLLQLDRGYEALSVKGGEIHRTRWYAELPDDEKWAAFARDAGDSIQSAQGGLPSPEHLPLLPQPPKNWKLHSAFLAPLSLWAWGLAAALAILGAGFLAALVYQVKLDLAVGEAQREIERVSRENVGAIELQNRIDTQAEYLGQLRRAQPEELQLELMRTLVESGLIDAAGKPSLIEWEYRNRQLRLLFLVPPNIVLSEFLARLEALPIFKEIRLLPDTPPGALGVQTVLAPWQPRAKPETSPEPEPKTDPEPAAQAATGGVPGVAAETPAATLPAPADATRDVTPGARQ